MMTTKDCYQMAQSMEHDGAAHGLTLALLLAGLSPMFGADLVKAVNTGRMSWDEVILALYFAVFAPADVHSKS